MFNRRDVFYAVQALRLLGEFDGGTWVRHIGRVFGRDFDGPLTQGQTHELLLRARREDDELNHTQGRAARMEGIFLAREIHKEDPARILTSARALADHYGVKDVHIDDAHDLVDIFFGLGRAFARAGVKERVHLVGDNKHEFILIREELRATPPFAPVVTYDPATDPRNQPKAAAPAPDSPNPSKDAGTSECPICPFRIPQDSRFCPACKVGVVRSSTGALDPKHPDLQRGESVFAWDFRAVPPPGCTSRTMTWTGGPDGKPPPRLTPHADGVLYEDSGGGGTTTLRDPQLRLRSGCVRFGFTALSEGCRLGIAVRDEAIGAAKIGYVLDLSVSTGVLFFARLVISPTKSAQTVLLSRNVAAPYLRPIGEPNELEIRMSGGWLVGYLNGSVALRSYDPAYGIGGVGFRVGREPDATSPVARIVLRSATVHWLGATS